MPRKVLVVNKKHTSKSGKKVKAKGLSKNKIQQESHPCGQCGKPAYDLACANFWMCPECMEYGSQPPETYENITPPPAIAQRISDERTEQGKCFYCDAPAEIKVGYYVTLQAMAAMSEMGWRTVRICSECNNKKNWVDNGRLSGTFVSY
jgi:ribosomal protein L37AE/L43A